MAKNASVSSGSGLIQETVSMTDSFQYVRPAGGVRSTAGETVKLMSRPTAGATVDLPGTTPMCYRSTTSERPARANQRHSYLQWRHR